MTNKKLIIVDEFLENKVGHYYEYNKSVMEAFVTKGFICKAYGKNTILPDIQSELNAQPFFNYNPKSNYRNIKIIGPVLYRFNYWMQLKNQIQKIIKIETKNNTEEVQFFFPNVFWYNIIPIANAIKKIKNRTSLLYRISIIEPIEENKFAKKYIPKLFKKYSLQMKKNKNIHFFSDSEVIADEFEKIINCKMGVLPIPHLTEINKNKIDNKTNELRLYLPGVARLDKGIEVITNAMELLSIQNKSVADNITLVLQFFGDKEKDSFNLLQQRLEKLNNKNIFLGSLSSNEYLFQLQNADVILIPYLLEKGYRARTSGVLAEAIAACKPFITIKNSWMDVQVKKYNTGITIENNNPQELCNAIIELYNNYNNYLLQTIVAKEKWFLFHSKNNFYNIFMQNN